MLLTAMIERALIRERERDTGERNAQGGAGELLVNRDPRRQPDARERGEPGGRDGDAGDDVQ